MPRPHMCHAHCPLPPAPRHRLPMGGERQIPGDICASCRSAAAEREKTRLPLVCYSGQTPGPARERHLSHKQIPFEPFERASERVRHRRRHDDISGRGGGEALGLDEPRASG
ncbi:unnamed protein product [Lota lota]